MASSRAVALSAALLALGAGCTGEPAASRTATAGEAASDNGLAEGGGAAPSVEATDARGVVKWLADHRGQPVLVNFWASWCAPCLAELPDLLAGTRAFRERGGVVLGVVMEQMGANITDEQALEKARLKTAQLGLDFPNLVCTDDDMLVVREILGVELGGLPQTLVYDRAGKLVEQHEGMATLDEFAALARLAER